MERLSIPYRLLNEKSIGLSHEKQWIDVIIHRVDEGLFSTDREGNILFVNAAAERLSGFPSSEMTGTPSGYFLKYPDGTPFTPVEVVSEIDLFLRQKGGHDLPIVVSTTAVSDEDDRHVGFVVIFRDVSEEKQLEKLKDDLTEMIAHDLRNTLGRIELSAQMLLSGTIGDLNPKQVKYVQASLDSTRRLLAMTSDLLDISRLEVNTMPIIKEPVDLAVVVDQSLESFRPSAEERRMTFVVKIPEGLPTPVADKQKLIRVLENLVGNAMKFSPDGTAVTIQAAYGTRSVVIRVIDQGEGIPEDYLTRIFEKFTQVKDRKSGKKEGSGLGLTFCKLVVQAHGGKILAESEMGEGSTFIFTLPID
ncbi:MAG: PAS domain S-box protein [Candidatus Latescibacteria bacterium]|nr:PAS domain S-box protein [Candidatus Latescibacterota bacterium]